MGALEILFIITVIIIIMSDGPTCLRDLGLEGVCLAGEDGHSVADAAFHLEIEAVKVHSLHVRLVPQCEHVPEHRFPLAEVQPIDVAVHQPVHSCRPKASYRILFSPSKSTGNVVKSGVD